MPEQNNFFTRTRNWYARFERPLSSLSLIGGFVFDAITLKRVDLFWENAWVVVHLTIVTVCVIWLNAIESKGGEESDPKRLHFWLVNIMQFFFGGILSTYLVFYFRSGTLASSWPFLLMLALAFVANESLKRYYARITFQITLLFLAFYAFAIYLIPILLHRISTEIFILSGFVSVAAIGLLLFIITLFSRKRFARSERWRVFAALCGVLIAVNVLYFSHLIPPLPLSLKAADVYHSITVNSPGDYTVTKEIGGGGFFATNETLHLVPGDDLWAYTSVFSPANFNLTIIHEWQYYDSEKSTWITRGRIPLSVVGGNDGGYRTFSEEPNVTPGAWRVNVETSNGAIIGRISFNVVTSTLEPALQTQTID